jgi:hypothetical protein
MQMGFDVLDVKVAEAFEALMTDSPVSYCCLLTSMCVLLAWTGPACTTLQERVTPAASTCC